MKHFISFLIFALILFTVFCFASCSKDNEQPLPTATPSPVESTPTNTQTPTPSPTSIPTPSPTPAPTVKRNVTYKTIGTEKLRADIYLPAQYEDSPKFGALFFFHGGGWMGGDKSDITDYYDIIRALNAHNIAVIGVQYRLCDTRTVFLPTPIYDCLDAVRYIIKNAEEYNIDTDNLGAFGTSAGGHLSLMAAFAQDHFYEAPELSDVTYKLKYVVDICGPTDLCVDYTDDSLRRAYETLLAVFGTDREGKLEEYKASSPINYIDSNSPKTLIIHGKADSYVPYTQSELLYNALIEKGVDATYIAVDGADHDFSPAVGHESTSHSVEDLLTKATQFILTASAQ